LQPSGELIDAAETLAPRCAALINAAWRVHPSPCTPRPLNDNLHDALPEPVAGELEAEE